MKTVLITGVSRGIGKALAEKFLKEGFSVIGTSTDGNSDIDNKNLKIFQLDLANTKSIEECTNQILSLNTPIDIFINNAAVYISEESDHTKSMENLRKVLDVNLINTIDFTQRLLFSLNNESHLINISSRQGSLAYPPGSATLSYKVSKAGLNMFTRVLSHELKGKTIVSCVHPGAVMTDMGAPDANMTPEESAEHIYKLALSKPETGQFWYKGELFPW